MPSLLNPMNTHQKRIIYLMKTILLYLEFFHYSGLHVPTFMELYPFGTIKSIKEDDVRFQMLFQKCTMACSTNFYRNRSTSVVSSPNILFCSFLPMLFWIISLIFMVNLFPNYYNYYLFEFFKLSMCPFLRKWKIGRKLRSRQIHTQLLKPTWMRFP